MLHKVYEYEQVLTEIKDMLESAQFEERKESLCKKVRALCEESKIEFFFVGGGESTWSVTNDKHIKKIVECHKAQLSQEGTTKDATSDTISRQAAIDVLDVLCQEHRYKIPGKIETYSQYNEAWQDALDRAEGAIFNLPSAQPEVIRCGQCKYAKVADPEDSQDGYTCQFHRGSIWFSGSYCSWAESEGEK